MISTRDNRFPTLPQLTFDPPQVVRFLLFAALFVALYHSAYHWLVTADWAREDYSASYFIPVIVLYLIWEKRCELAAVPSAGSWGGLWLLVPALFLFWLGELAGEYFSLYLSSWLMAVGVLWLHMGRRKLARIAFPLCLALFMFPLPNILYTRVSFNLKMLSSQLGVGMLRLSGMSAYREGNVIDLGFTQLQVVDACNGLRYLIPLIVLGMLVAYFYKGRLWKRVLLVLSTIPLAIVTNGLRIASVGFLYPIWGAKVAEGFFHDFSGWFIFMATLALLLLEMQLLKRIFPERPMSETCDRQTVAHAESTVVEERAEPKSGGWQLLLARRTLLALCLMGLTAAAAQGVQFRERIPIKRPFAQFPETVQGWTGQHQSMESKFVEALDFSDYVIIDYHDGTGKSVNFYTAYYETQRKGESIHSPSTCLPGSGWVFQESGDTAIRLADGRDILVNRAFMQKGPVKELTYYWFPQRGRIITSAWELKFFVFWDALTRQRTDGALVRLITPVYENERVADAEARLQGFVRAIVPVLDEFIPGGKRS
jgi:exosortase D (VPLPA-CTERM-specific)